MSIFQKTKKNKGPRRRFIGRTTNTAVRSQKRTNEDKFFQELVPGTVFSRVYFDRGSTIFRYEVSEPEIKERVLKLYNKYKIEFIGAITNPNLYDTKKLTKKDAAAQFVRALKATTSFTSEELNSLTYYVDRDIIGFGKIDPLMKDTNIEDVSCDSPGSFVFVFHKAFGFIPTNIKYEDDTELDTFIKKILQDVGRHISISNPIVDSTLEDGSRISTSLGRYITNKGSSFTIRKFKEEPMTPLDLIQKSLCKAKVFAYFWLLTEYGGNVMIVGGTATGKTTLLNAILLFIPSQKKIISIEDTREINLIHENWVPMITRTGYGKLNSETGKRAGEIDMFDLLTVTMRQRPSYVIVGEVRGAEAFTLFQAMSIGRYVYGTFHADDINTFIHRMESKPINIPRNLLLTLDVVVILKNILDERGSRRRIKTVSEIAGQDIISKDIVINNAFIHDNQSDTQTYSGFSYAIKKIADKEGKFENELEREVEMRTEILERMIEKGISNYKDFYYMVNQFYKDRKKVLQSLGLEDYIQV
jgi:flagellar protein FlaI